MMMRIAFVILMMTMSCISQHANAHHGRVGAPSLYDASNLVILQGEITEVFWRYPHVRFGLRVQNEAGEQVVWELEWGIPKILEEQGITKDLFPVGAHYKVAGYSARRFSRSLGVLHLLMPDGSEFAPEQRALIWSDRRVGVVAPVLDPERVEADRQSADGIFRVWSGTKLPTKVDAAHNFDHLLTPAGKAALAAWDPVKHPVLTCTPRGMPGRMLAGPFQFLNQGDRIELKSIWWGGSRIFHLGEDDVPENIEPNRLGYSRGHFDNGDLVVKTTNVEWPYFDRRGTPQSNQVEYLERFEVSEDGSSMLYTLTATDPVMFTEPVTVKTDWKWTPGREVHTSDCVLWDGT